MMNIKLARLGGAVALALVFAVTGCSSDSGTGTNGDGGKSDGSTNMDGSTNGDGSTNNGDGSTNMDGSTNNGDGSTNNGDASTSSDAGWVELDGGGRCYLKPCPGSKTYACGDCVDNDHDGLMDDEDPDCLGPCDNNEEGFELKIKGNPLSGCDRDCYYDDNSGAGNDGCDWALQCDPKTPIASCCDPNVTDLASCGGSSNQMQCPDTDPSQVDGTYAAGCADDDPATVCCTDVCSPLVPNGCDCFGCCDIRTTAAPSTEHWIYIGTYDPDMSGNKVGTCNLAEAQAGNDDACRPCTPNPACVNTCGECELCIGKDTIPDYCTNPPPPDGGTTGPDGSIPDASVPPMRCPAGIQACGLPTDPACPSGQFCLTGCCINTGT